MTTLFIATIVEADAPRPVGSTRTAGTSEARPIPEAADLNGPARLWSCQGTG